MEENRRIIFCVKSNKHEIQKFNETEEEQRLSCPKKCRKVRTILKITMGGFDIKAAIQWEINCPYKGMQINDLALHRSD